MARWVIHSVVIGVLLAAVALGLRDRMPPAPARSTNPYSLDWTTPLQQMRPTFWGVWHLDDLTRTALPASLRGIRAVAVAVQQSPQCTVHLRLLCPDDTAAHIAAEALEGIIAMAFLEHRSIPWLTPSLRSISVRHTGHRIDLSMLCTTPQLKQLLQELLLL